MRDASRDGREATAAPLALERGGTKCATAAGAAATAIVGSRGALVGGVLLARASLVASAQAASDLVHNTVVDFSARRGL